HPESLFLVERGQHGLLVGVGHAEDPAELSAGRRSPALGGALGAGLAEGVLERIDDERRGNRFGHTGLPGKVGCILLEDSAFQKGLPMRRTIACIIVLASLGAAGTATGQEPKTEEQKTFYALG